MENYPRSEDSNINSGELEDKQLDDITGAPYGISNFRVMLDLIEAKGGKITHVDVDLGPPRETKTINLVDGYL